ncbi:MAG: hypothetical protein J6V28_05295, partial [Tidjanibacter sp.]|nr:hypothetical protein [Tidjanibacter sp.]
MILLHGSKIFFLPCNILPPLCIFIIKEENLQNPNKIKVMKRVGRFLLISAMAMGATACEVALPLLAV